jgi:hypothetical protein
MLVVTVGTERILTVIVMYCIVLYCIEEVVIAAQRTATFSDLLYSPDVSMPIKFCSEAYFFGVEVL